MKYLAYTLCGHEREGKTEELLQIGEDMTTVHCGILNWKGTLVRETGEIHGFVSSIELVLRS